MCSTFDGLEWGPTSDLDAAEAYVIRWFKRVMSVWSHETNFLCSILVKFIIVPTRKKADSAESGNTDAGSEAPKCQEGIFFSFHWKLFQKCRGYAAYCALKIINIRNFRPVPLLCSRENYILVTPLKLYKWVCRPGDLRVRKQCAVVVSSVFSLVILLQIKSRNGCLPCAQAGR